MTRPADIPQWLEQQAETLCHELPLVNAGGHAAEASKRITARALLAAYERGRGEPNIDKGKIIETVCPQGVDEWSVSLVLDAIRKGST